MYSLSCMPSNSQLIVTTTRIKSLKPSRGAVSCQSQAPRAPWAHVSSPASGGRAGTRLGYAHLFVPAMQLAVAHLAEQEPVQVHRVQLQTESSRPD